MPQCPTTCKLSSHPFSGKEFFRQLISAGLVWVMVMMSLPSYAVDAASESKGANIAEAPPISTGYHDNPGNSRSQFKTRYNAAHSLTRSSVQKVNDNPPEHARLETVRKPGNVEPVLLASLANRKSAGALPSAIPSSAFSWNKSLLGPDLAPLMLPAAPKIPFLSPVQASVSPLQVSVGFADSTSPTVNFPEPWNEGNPLVNFVGGGTSYRAGAIRLDNSSGAAVTIDSVTVDLGRPGPVFQLWTNIAVPPNGAAILTQTTNGNFNTSASPIVGCGQPLAANETRIPKITVTIAGAGTDYLDTAHVLDTGGFDSSCRGNQSLQWRVIGTAGMEAPAGSIQLTGENAPHAVGTSNAFSIQVSDAGNQPLPNAPVALKVVNGPNSGQTFSGVTDGNGNAAVQYSSSAQGTDLLQAVITNPSGGMAQSQQISTRWTSAAACTTPSGQNAAATQLVYVGQTIAGFGNQVTLAALLIDGTGNPLTGRALSGTVGSEILAATTDTNGIATLAVSSLPVGTNSIAFSFAGDQNFQAAQLTSAVTIQPAATLLRYTGTELFASLGQQAVSAVLTDAQGRIALANRKVSFAFNGATVNGTTDSNGAVTASFDFQTAQTTGAAQLQISFAGDADYQASSRTAKVEVYQTTTFVIWGGNREGLKIGQKVNFFGRDWSDQIQDRELREDIEFNGFALLGPKSDRDDDHDRDSPAPLSAAPVIRQCQTFTTSRTVTPGCWHTGDEEHRQDRPPKTLSPLIEVIVATAIRDYDDRGTFGNIACGAVLKIEPRKARREGDDEYEGGDEHSQNRFGVILAVNGDCAGVFPPPAVLVASQQQSNPVLAGQQVSIAYNIANQGGTDATNVTLAENFDQLTPATGTANVGSVAAGASATGSFLVTVPVIDGRQSVESTVDYESRLAASDGRLFTAEGEITFTDQFAQLYPPLDISSFSQLNLPRLEVGLSGANCIAPGAQVAYSVRIDNVGSARAQQIGSSLTLPDNSTAPLTVPDLPAGMSFAGNVNWQAPGVAAKSSSESTQSYLARLAAADGATLPAAVIGAAWKDALSNSYGPVQQPFTSLTQRVPIVSTTVPPTQSLLPNQKTQFSFTANNNGSGNAVQVTLTLKRQDGSLLSIPNFSLPGGQSGVVTGNYVSPAISPKGLAETDSDYLTRLASISGTTLGLDAILSWTDAAHNVYGPTDNPFAAKEVLPILSIALSGPATAQAGNSVSYGVAATNIGSAVATAVNLALTLPDGAVKQLAAGPLAPGGTFQTTVSFAVPVAQASGPISARLSALWNDSTQNSYGPLSSSTVTTVTSQNILTLAPPNVGPDVTGTTQAMTAVVKGPAGTPISGVTVQFVVTGANSKTGNAITDATGTATFTYTGVNSGTDSVVASSGGLVSNSATVTWLIPIQNVSTSTIFGRFFTSDGSGGFDTSPTVTPVFSQTFPTINFNPPGGTIPGDTSGVGEFTRPFTDVTTDLNGNFTGTIVAQGNGLQAGVGTLFQFQAVFTSVFTVAGPGDVTFTFFSDDGFMFGVGGGATRVSGPLVNVPASGFTPFENLPVVGAFNIPTGPVGNVIVVHFPAAGSYPYEVDYSECCGGELALTMASGQVNSKGVPPSGSMVISPNNPPTLAAGQTQTFSVQAFDSSGAPVQNLGVALIVNGANAQELSAITDSSGRASFSYTAGNAGTDTVQAIGNISGLGAISNIVTVNWNVPAGGVGTGGTTVFAPQGWIGQPLIGATLLGQLPITVAQGISLTSGTLEFWPTAHPDDIHIISNNTTGSGTIGVFDGTTLANGGYTIQLQATASNGIQQTSVVTVNVIGESKPGRITTSVTDLRVPLAGIPIAVTRTYDSLKRNQTEDFGHGWSLSVGVDLEVDASNNVTFTVNGRRQTFFFQAQGSSFLFPWLLTPTYIPQPGLHGTLTSDGCSDLVQVQSSVICFPTGSYQPTTYTYTDATGRVYSIASNGQLKTIKDLNGNLLTLTLTGITSSNGGVTIPFSRDAENRITQITDLSGNKYIYSYDSAGNLSSVVLPGIATPASYIYSSDHLLLNATDPRGNGTQAAYFPDGRLQSLTDPLGNVTQFSYDAANNTTKTVNQDGGVEVRTNNSFGKPVIIIDSLNRTTTNTYDANQNLLTQTDALGKVTTFTYDVNGFQTSAKDPLGNTISRVYDQNGQATSVTDALGNKAVIAVDAASNPIQESDSLGQLLAGSYDGNGNVTTLVNANGKVTQFSYDASGNTIKVIDPLNRITSYTYDAMNRRVSKTEPRGFTTQFGYDPLGRLISVTDANNKVTGTEYDVDGNKTADIDVLGRRTTYAYDAANRLIKITYPDQTTRSYTYDFRANKLTETDQLNRVTKYTYDLAGQLTSTTYAFGTPDAATVFYTYDLDGRQLTETDARGNLRTYGYDDAGRLISVKNSLGQTASFGYDASNNLISVTDTNQTTTTFVYDIRSRLTSIINPDKTTIQFTYDGLGNQLKEIDPAGQATLRAYDDISRLVAVTNALNQTTRYVYDPASNLLSVTDANQHTTSFQYDNLNRRTSRTLPLGMVENNTYDAAGNLTAKSDFNGKTTKYTYDALNRLLTKTPDPSLNQPAVSFIYTATGQRASMIDASGTTTYSYDNRDRLLSKATPEGTLSYTYDAQGNVLTIGSSNPNGSSMAYSYDAVNRLTTATDNRLLAQNLGPAVTSYNYDAAGNLAKYVYPNRVQTAQAFDTLNRLTQMSSSNEQPLSNYAYSLDPVGNRLSVTELGGRQVNYGYDANYRLTSEAVFGDAAGNNGAINYSYDAVGNRLQLTSTLNAIPTSGLNSYDANDRLTLDAYDANGNTISLAGISSAYDFEDHMTQHGAVSIVYDGDGNRVAETVGGVTTQFLVETLNPTGYAQILDELQNGIVVRSYSYGLARISEDQTVGSSPVPSFYGYDGHGNVRFLMDAAGTVTDTYQFDAFGNLISSTGTTPNNFRYSAEESDDILGLYYLRARYLDSRNGRFNTMDPEPGKTQDPSTFHRYLYTRDNPVNFVDPSGRQEFLEYAALIESNVEGYGRLPKAYTACTAGLYAVLAQSFQDAVDGVPVDVETGQQATEAFQKCLYKAELPPGIRESLKEAAKELVESLLKKKRYGDIATFIAKQIIDKVFAQYPDLIWP
ncbi:MAG TPA: RHS repeat-associated core domain-containing protein [Candidatus Angelobacter sp.]|nr:RHS repeat-associated core domain-containing protein [Candidatus Angelobacter sp.]